LVIYQAGADAWIDDPYGCGYLTFEELGFRDSGIFDACRKHQIPAVWNLAGGYTNPMDMTVAIHLQTLAASDETV
jgi:acetoin utilization deacetylase AcuC-like enzyme